MYGHFIRATWPGWRPCLCLGHSPCSSSCGSELTEMSPPQRALPDWPHLKQPSGCPSPHCFSFVSVSAWQSSHSCEQQFESRKAIRVSFAQSKTKAHTEACKSPTFPGWSALATAALLPLLRLPGTLSPLGLCTHSLLPLPGTFFLPRI